MSRDANQRQPTTVAIPMTDGTDQTETAGMEPQRASDAELAELYEAHGPVLLKFLLRLTHGDRRNAEDILQETMVRAWRHPEAHTADGGWSRSWLFTVARRIAIDHMRATRSRPTEIWDEHLGERSDDDDHFDRQIDINEVRAVMASLPIRFREVLIELYFLDRSVAQAAESLGVPVGTIKSRTFYALRALQEALHARGFHAR